MCLELPLELVELRPDGTALARHSASASGSAGGPTGAGESRLLEVSLLTLDSPDPLDAPVAPGDWVLAHAGFALHRITADAARAALSIREETP